MISASHSGSGPLRLPGLPFTAACAACLGAACSGSTWAGQKQSHAACLSHQTLADRLQLQVARHAEHTQMTTKQKVVRPGYSSSSWSYLSCMKDCCYLWLVFSQEWRLDDGIRCRLGLCLLLQSQGTTQKGFDRELSRHMHIRIAGDCPRRP